MKGFLQRIVQEIMKKKNLEHQTLGRWDDRSINPAYHIQDCRIDRGHAWVLLLYRYIYSFSERRPLAPTCFREVFYICMSKSIFHWSHRENLTVASIDKRSRKNFCTLIIFPLYQIKAFTILYWHFLGMQPTVPKKSFAIFYSWLKNPDKWEFRNN